MKNHTVTTKFDFKPIIIKTCSLRGKKGCMSIKTSN